jgi:FtsH-binding integral membrane protein
MGVPFPAGVLVRTGAERAALVRRTYALVFISVLCTVAGATFALSQPQLMQAVAAHPIIAFFCTLTPLMITLRARDAFPANIALVLLFTFVVGVVISPVLYLYGRTQPGLITQAAILTIGAFGVLTLYAFVSRRDFSAWGSFFIMGLYVLIGTMFLNIFFRNPAMDLWLAGITVIIFGGLLVFDTWRIRNVYGPDEYVGAAVSIYLDLLNLFLGILRVLGGRRS